MTAKKSSGKPSSYCCRKKFETVYQFKISLQDIKPTIWRQIQVPDRYSFWDLHCANTDCLGWLDYHLHQFKIIWPESGETDIIGIPDDDRFEDDPEILPGWNLSIAEYFSMENASCTYEYDFGDGWKHTVTLEAILPREEGIVYPRCVDGGNACPPEDVGGPWGYEDFLKTISRLNAARRDELLQWCGGWFDPEWFDLDVIRFGNPQSRWRVAFDEQPVPRTMRQVQYHVMRERD